MVQNTSTMMVEMTVSLRVGQAILPTSVRTCCRKVIGFVRAIKRFFAVGGFKPTSNSRVNLHAAEWWYLAGVEGDCNTSVTSILGSAPLLRPRCRLCSSCACEHAAGLEQH